MNSRRYKLGENFPNEGFVQRVIEQHFASLGFQVEPVEHTDFVCVHPETSERWVIEAKGQTGDVGTDFRTGLGQIVQRGMADPSATYAIAVPQIPQFLNQCRQVAPWVRQALRLHWLVVAADATIRVYRPRDEL